MVSAVSAKFEKDLITSTGEVRVIVKNLDEGRIPPSPSSTYFPTEPNSIRDFIVIEYVSDTIGERFARVATLSDFSSLDTKKLIEFEDSAADFVFAGVTSGDTLEVSLSDDTIWTSDEYPSGNPFVFVVDSVLSATKLKVFLPFPAFATNLSWSIPSRSITGSAGATRREGSPAGSTEFLDRRFNNYLDTAAEAESFVAATKADMESLATNSTGDGLTDEKFTGESSV